MLIKRYSFFILAAGLILLQAPYAFSQTEEKELSISLEDFKGPVDPATIEKDYNQISVIWQKGAEDLKHTVSNRPEVSSEQESVEPWLKDVSTRFDLLRETSRQRERYLRALRDQGKSLFATDDQTVERMVLEVTLIPYKFLAYFYEKSFWARQNGGRGFQGYFYLMLELLILLSICLVPLVFFKASKKVEYLVEDQKRRSFRYSFKSRWHRSMTGILSVLSEYLPWIFTFVALKAVGLFLTFSEFQEFSHILPYFFFYVYYKVFRVTLELVLRELAAQTSVEYKGDINQKIQSTSRFLGLILFFVFSLKTAFQSILGESLIFSMIEPFFGFVILFLLFYVSARWELEIENYLRNSNILILQKYSKFMENRYSLFLSLPGLFLIFIHYSTVRFINWSSQFDLVKILYAKVLRVKYETSRDDSSGLERVGDEYIEAFNNHKSDEWLQLYLEWDIYKKLKNQMDSWLSGENIEQTAAISGPKGSGKTVFLRQCQNEFEEQGVDCVWLSVPPKTFTERSFESLFEDILDTPKDVKKVVILDNAHNLFLATIGGFQIYQRFLEEIEARRNIFWVASFNDFSWQFLNSVLGKNQYFRIDLSMPRWEPEQIRDLILGVHKKMDWSLTYDQIFRSSQRLHEGVTSAENRYFYLVWEKSTGNPSFAISNWFKSLRVLGNRRLKVCLPGDNPVGELGNLHLEMHFVYASIVKHENLNISEATRATNMSRAVVKQAFYRGVEEDFLIEVKGRYTVKTEWFDDLKRYLKGKNLLYES